MNTTLQVLSYPGELDAVHPRVGLSRRRSSRTATSTPAPNPTRANRFVTGPASGAYSAQRVPRLRVGGDVVADRVVGHDEHAAPKLRRVH